MAHEDKTPKLKAVGGADPEVPPWERPNLGYYGTGEEKAEADLHFRVSQKEMREVQKLVQQRRVPFLETKSDVGRLGLRWVHWWIVHMLAPDTKMQETLDLIMWEEKVRGAKRYRERLTGLLDDIETELVAAAAANRTGRVKELVEDLKQHGAKIEDEDLKAKAQRLWIKYRMEGKPDAKK